MWLGIPYTGYGYNIHLPVLSRMFIFCFLSAVIYFILSFPQTMRVVGNISGFSRYDDKEGTDIYYLNAIHGIVYGIIIFLLLRYYNPYPPKKI